MCGIWVSLNCSDNSDRLDRVRHRGPDGSGFAHITTRSGELFLGHHRLSIYDVDARSDQPMWSADDRYVIVFNGAIYNFLEIRRELEGEGYQFRTASDTEVLLTLWQTRGAEGLAALDGMFVFALFDRRTQHLVLARDRFGEKPLYVRQTDHNGQIRLELGSEIGQFNPGEHGGINHALVARFLNWGGCSKGDETFVSDIHHFPPASFAILDLSRSKNWHWRDELRAFWSPPETEELDHGSALVEELRSHLEQSVRLRLVADVPVGACVSGGLDSSGIVMLAAQSGQMNSPLTGVSAIYDASDEAGNSLSERKYVEALNNTGALDVLEIAPSDGEVAASIDEVIAAQGEPFSHSSVCLQWFVFKRAKEAGLKVMLDGQGADELFAGYSHMAAYRIADLLRRGDVFRARQEIKALSADQSDLTSRSLWANGVSIAFVQGGRGRLDRAITADDGALVASEYSPAPIGRARGSSYLEELVRELSLERSLPSLLRFEDRNAMWHGIESRMPYLAPAVADLAFRLPSANLIARGETKRVLREALRPVLPGLIASRRRKLGFVTPQHAWMHGALGRWVAERISDPVADLGGLVNARRLARLREGAGRWSAADGSQAFRLAVMATWVKSRKFGV